MVAGIDVGKAPLDVSVAAGPVRCFANSAPGITALARWLAGAGLWRGSKHGSVPCLPGQERRRRHQTANFCAMCCGGASNS